MRIYCVNDSRKSSRLPSFESVPIKQDATPGDIAWIEARELEFPELRVEQQPQRRYPSDGSLAHVVGYVGEIGPEQLKQPAYREKKLKPGDVIGQSGLEQSYDDYLRGRDGYRELLSTVAAGFRMKLKLFCPNRDTTLSQR